MANDDPTRNNCPIRQRTGDGQSVGRCWYYCPCGICPLHGDVREYLKHLPELTDERDLPPDWREKAREHHGK